MPQQSVPPILYQALEKLEDHTISTNKQKYANYEAILTVLRSDCEIPVTALKRLLAVCNHDLKEDMKFATCVVNTISIILKDVMSEKYSRVPELLSSALAILHLLKRTAAVSKVQALQSLCLETLLSYPDVVYTKLAELHHTELMDVLSLFLHQGIGVKFMPFDILKKILKSLPPDKRRDFTEQGINIWFSKLVPTSMTILNIGTEHVPKVMDVLELITDELEHIDYAHNVQWQRIFDFICVSKAYPAMMMSLLQNGNESWCQLWIIFVRLLKQQITTVKKSGTPINSMLPVVEAAFKMDQASRCQAFRCWKVLINILSTDSNETSTVNKRVKLLIVPLLSNNARVEQVALAKFDTWWHLLRRYQSRMDTLAVVIYIPFLHFCFGNPKLGKDNNVLISGMLSLQLKKLCLQALVESTGHTGCEGCIDLAFPRLSRTFLTPNQLQEHSREWLHVIKTVIMTCGSEDMYCEDVKQQVRCIWKSFLVMLTRVPESNRKVILNELLDSLLELIEAANTEPGTLELIYDVLHPSCIADAQARSLFSCRDRWNDSEAHLPRLLAMLLHPTMQRFYNDSASKAPGVLALTLFMTAALDSSDSPDDMVSWLLPRLPDGDPGLVMWTALLTAVETSEAGAETVKNVMLWPLRQMQMFENVQRAASVWNAAYTSLKPKLNGIEADISQLLLSNKTTSQFSLYAVLQILKSVLEVKKSFDCTMEAKMLVKVFSNIKDVGTVATMFPVIVDAFVLMATKVAEDPSSVLAELTLRAAKSVMDLTIRAKKSLTDDNDYHIQIEKFLKSINDLYKADDDFIKLKTIVAEDFIEYCTVFEELPSVKGTAISILKTFFNSCQENEEPIYSMIKDAIDSTNKMKPDQGSADTEFAAPEKGKAKKTKRKQPKIVKTVVENGEEYTVIQSNWKFNPKKLTENQKEKLQKKREDIPALYQDLSQSQDEFKLASWKTDSQDASSTSTSSKSASNAGNTDASTVLLKMPSAEVVPKIMENIFSDGNKDAKKTEAANENINCDSTSPTPNRITAVSTPKQPRSPRMALKDRVFQNVKNLTEKSFLPREVKSPKAKELNQTSIEMAPRTPLLKVNETNATYSAPPKLPADRPSRMKRKPKKYERDFLDLELLKKKRINSTCDLQREQTAGSQDVFEDGKQTVVEVIVYEKPTKKVTPEREPVDGTSKEEEPTVTAPPTTKSIEPEVAKCDAIVIDDIDDDIVEETPKPKMPEVVAQIKKANKVQEDTQDNDVPKIGENINTPSPDDITENAQKDTEKIKSSTKKKTSRIEKTLAIDMVEGHPFLNSEKRTTRKSVTGTVISTRRKNLTAKLNTSLSKSECKVDIKKTIYIIKPKVTEEKSSEKVKELFAVKETQDSISSSTDDMPTDSEDFIESSQDSTLTTISMKSTKSSTKELPVVKVNSSNIINASDTECLLYSSRDTSTDNLCANQDTKDDFEFPQNKSVPQENDQNDLTADMDTEPMVDKKVTISSFDDVIVVSDHIEPIEVDTSDESDVMETQDTANADTQVTANAETQVTANAETQGDYIDTQDTANADTQRIDPNFLASQEGPGMKLDKCGFIVGGKNIGVEIVVSTTEEPMNIAVTKSADNSESGLSSPFKDEEQRNKDFLNNTLEISPIKTMSPIKDSKTATSETSSDYVVILSSPVQGDGEPFDKNGSPEIFTEDKVSPDKRDLSPPREGTSTNTGSPSSSLSLKKNRPQVRPSGRAAQMLGLCVENRLTFKSNDKPAETEEPKKAMLAPARRNLRILYNCENNEANEVSDESQTFLKFKKSLPTAACSPSGPILKRKMADMADETTESPASKRKRVSFHDPPVSNSISVHKYIEPLSLMRSPQSSTKKQGRLARQAAIKPPKKLETIFAQTSALTELAKTVENIPDPTCSEDISSLEQTPSVEVVTTTDLDDTEPICPGLIDCKDPIVNIASDLSSPAMKTLLIKELEGIVETVGDLARMSELEVNRLCIKAPKVKVAKKVLSAYEQVLSECASKTIEVAMSETDDKIIHGVSIDLTSEEVKEPAVKETKTIEVAMSETDDKIIQGLSIDLTSEEVKEPAVKETKTIEVAMSETDDKIIQGVSVDLPSEEVKDTAAKETQTDTLSSSDMDIQTDDLPVTVLATVETQTSVSSVTAIHTQTSLQMATTHTQTKKVTMASCKVQTDESGVKSTKDIVASLLERPGYINEVSAQMDVEAKAAIADSLPLPNISQLIAKRLTSPDDSELILETVLRWDSDRTSKDGLDFLKEYLAKTYGISDLILFCSNLLKDVHDKPV